MALRVVKPAKSGGDAQTNSVLKWFVKGSDFTEPSEEKDVNTMLSNMLWWFQPDISQPTGVAPSSSSMASQGSPAGSPTPESCAMNSGLFLVMLVLFYFLLIRPQRKRQKEVDAMLKALKKGDVVRTSGGVRGEIVSITERDATLQIADRVKINILLSNIVGLDKPVEPETQKK